MKYKITDVHSLPDFVEALGDAGVKYRITNLHSLPDGGAVKYKTNHVPRKTSRPALFDRDVKIDAPGGGAVKYKITKLHLSA